TRFFLDSAWLADVSWPPRALSLARRQHMNRLVWALGITLLLGGVGRAIDIGFCGLDVPPGQVGVLQADLTCSGVGVELEEMATLQMNGHSISGGSIGVFCSRRCTIQGPGEIIGASSFGIVTS